ncbi:MAG: PTS sugar transporter subunit IIA [Candidatus Fimousia sp.]
MLREFVEKKHYKFAQRAESWQDAIRMSCEVLEADGTVEDNYKEDIVECVTKYGPYIVIMPNIAMPHSQECAEGVHKTSIAFMKLEEPVSFEEGNPELDAKLFFTLASCNPEQHLNNMQRLTELMLNEDAIAALMDAKTPEDLLEIQEKYLDVQE